ncbi:hypothetical protein TUMSATVNIG1_59350 (plasmid) [Vibrio nigripulchritudo]|nr:hypothetical protein TUMSATVNIG1_59350 [Vibrio nigripulchritudo]
MKKTASDRQIAPYSKKIIGWLVVSQGCLNLTHTQTFDDEKLHQNRHNAMDIRDQLKANVDNKVDKYLDGEL